MSVYRAGGGSAAEGDIGLRRYSHLSAAMNNRANHLVAYAVPIGEVGCAYHRNTQGVGPTLHVHLADVLESHRAMSGGLIDVVIPQIGRASCRERGEIS